MMRSLYSAVSGLKAHQTMMDTIGNNIANVNTPGFKTSRVTFATMLSQTLKGAAAPTTIPVAQGGSNAAQVGLGTQIGSIDQIMSQGSAENTGKWSDMMVQGDGFFVLSDAGKTVYSRAGDFTTDSNGNLVDASTGAYVQGPPTPLATLTGSEPGWGGTTNDYTYSSVALKGLDGVIVGGTLILPSSGSALTPTASNQTTYDPTTGTIHFYTQPTSSSTVALYGAVSQTPVSAGSNSNGSLYSIQSNSLVGVKPPLTDNTGASLGTEASSIANIGSGSDYYLDPSTGTLTFDGAFLGITATSAGVPTNVQAGFTLTPTNNIYIPPNTYSSLSVDQNGNITGTDSSGTVTNLGQVNLATFANESGLTSVGNNYYVTSNNSGAAVIGAPNTGSAGSIVSDALEMSNVDLGQEMTNMIVAQRGFEANSRVITVTDTFLQTLVNLKQQ